MLAPIAHRVLRRAISLMPENPQQTFRSRITALWQGLGHELGWRKRDQTATTEAGEPHHPCIARADRMVDALRARGLPEALLETCFSGPLAAGDARFVERSNALDRLSLALEAWRRQRPLLVALIGTQGGGSTTLLRQLEGRLESGETISYRALATRVHSRQEALAQCAALFDLQLEPACIEALIDRINALEPRFLVIDNGHFLACRIMGASDAILTFGAVMVATQERHQWILACHSEAWRRLSHVYQADRYFAEVIELDNPDKAALGAMIDARFAAAGFALATPDGVKPEAPALSEARLAALHQLSRGLPTAAFFHLLHAIEPTADGGFTLTDFRPIDYSALKGLARSELFTLAEITVHGALTSAEHQAMFRTSEEESQMTLQRLCGLCLLERVSSADGQTRFGLVAIHMPAVATQLANANYLY